MSRQCVHTRKMTLLAGNCLDVCRAPRWEEEGEGGEGCVFIFLIALRDRLMYILSQCAVKNGGGGLAAARGPGVNPSSWGTESVLQTKPLCVGANY